MRTEHTGAKRFSRPEWLWPAAVRSSAPAMTAMPSSFRRHRQARLDKLFERLLQAYRQTLLAAIACQAGGPARHLQAHINGLAKVVAARGRGVSVAAKLLQQARYQRIWQDFVAEACAGDPEDHGLANVARYTADARHLVRVQERTQNQAIAAGMDVVATIAIQRELLALCTDSLQAHPCADLPMHSSAPNEPYRTH